MNIISSIDRDEMKRNLQQTNELVGNRAHEGIGHEMRPRSWCGKTTLMLNVMRESQPLWPFTACSAGCPADYKFVLRFSPPSYLSVGHTDPAPCIGDVLVSLQASARRAPEEWEEGKGQVETQSGKEHSDSLNSGAWTPSNRSHDSSIF